MAKRRTRSLSLQIGLLYMFLAVINILFFSAMIFENQSDLLLKNFKFQSDQVVSTVINDLEGIQISRESDENLAALAGALKAKGMNSFVIFGSDGDVWHRFPPDPNGEKTVPAALKRKSLEISGETADFRSRYTKELNQDDFSVQFLLPLRARDGNGKPKDKDKQTGKDMPGKDPAAKEPGTDPAKDPAKEPVKEPAAKEPAAKEPAQDPAKKPGVDGRPDKQIATVFLSTRVSIKEIQNRLKELYFQMGLAVAWGVLFHVVFGIFVYRVIFRRLGVLKDTSEKMAEGQLSARADWKSKRGDELDELGEAFNNMATSIEDKVATISKLNEQIQQELEIGKEVQELFLPPAFALKKHHTATFFKPLREVSGDVYSVFDLSDKYRGLFFADASGHGVSAALVTTITLMNLENVLKETINPQQVLGRLNQIMSDKFQSSFYATSVFCLIGDGVVVYCNAG
ncbi:MAG: SpoIIE family protein phosphatase, partial [Spirochaetia bacterium]|nr:SpoIIE family protein phosphatase [Spirochaetia bacterium]